MKALKCSIISASADAARREIEAMMQDYLLELAPFMDESPDGNSYISDRVSKGSASNYPYLPFYWQSADRFPYLMRLEEKTVGFALVRQEVNGHDGNPLFEMAEFYVVPAKRRRQLGMQGFRLLLDCHPGQWQLAVLSGNAPALQFWRHCLQALEIDHRQVETRPGWLFEISCPLPTSS